MTTQAGCDDAALLLVLINRPPPDQTPFELVMGVAQGLARRDPAFPYIQVSRHIGAENLLVVDNADRLSAETIDAHARLAAQRLGLEGDLATLRQQPFGTPTGLKGTVVWCYCSRKV